MDKPLINESDNAQAQVKLEQELAEVKLRSLERNQTKTESPPNVEFTDKTGRPITVRTWESGNQAFVRAYDTSKVPVPENVNPGQAGYANATLEKSANGDARVRLNDIQTTPEYRGAGTAGQMLNQVEQFAKKNGASEIYGSIDSQGALDFWNKQADQGWMIDSSKSYYGQVYKKL